MSKFKGTKAVNQAQASEHALSGGGLAEGGTDKRAKRALGNSTKSAVKKKRSRKEQYILQAVCESVLGKRHRVSSCQKVPSFQVQNGSAERGISKNAETGRAYYDGMGSCGDVWNCPVCAEKITTGRTKEVLHALKQHRENGGIALLVSHTIKHSRSDSLEKSFDGLRAASRKMKSYTAYKKMKKSLGMIGAIQAKEFTWGNRNGWHPHNHEIWFLEKSVTKKQIAEAQKVLSQTWEVACLKSGLEKPSKLRGARIDYRDDGTDNIGAYVTKWGFELTYSNAKTTRKDGDDRYTPFEMIQKLKSGYDPKFYALYREYARTVKGKSQLFWSRGLKDMFGVKELSDNDLAERPEDIRYLTLSAQEMSSIIYYRVRGEVLDIAESQTASVTRSYIDSLVRKYINESRNDFNYKRNLAAQIKRDTIEHCKNSGISHLQKLFA